MIDINSPCLIVENNFLIGLDLAELLRSLGFSNMHHTRDEAAVSALITNTTYEIAFIDFDQGEDIAKRLASQMRSQGAAIIFTSTLFDRADMPNTLGEYKLLSKPYSATALKDILELI